MTPPPRSLPRFPQSYFYRTWIHSCTPRLRLRQGRVELGGTLHATDEKTEAQRWESDMPISHKLVMVKQGFKQHF